MYFTYLRRELSGRKKQSIIVAIGLAVAIALVMVVNALSGGVSQAQAQALSSVYGVGTDLTVTGSATQPGEGQRGQRFDFGSGAGESADGTTSLSSSRLMTDMMRGTLDATTVATVAATDGVAAATGTLSLTNTTFSGELPDFSQMQQNPGTTDGGAEASPGAQGATPPQGGPDGAGGSSFGVDSFSVLGVDPAATTVGPLSSVTLADGRLLTSGDDDAAVAVVDATYATSNEITVGSTIEVGGTDVEVVGIVASGSSDAETAADVFLPLTTAQTLSEAGEVVSTVYVQAASASEIGAVQTALAAALPDATVNSQSDLAETVSGSLSSATSLITNLGLWLSILVLAVALLLAVLLTVSGVTRRTREFGTLKAIGWSDARVVSQVAGESLVQGLLGGVIGIVLGLAAIIAINVIAPTISSAPSATGMSGPGGFPGGGGGFPGSVQTASEITLSAPITLWVILAAVGVAVLGGLVAGVFGGWRAARLSPSEALRAVN
jgi:ABC-type antimicrobial peptide transport system permease subunit